MSDLCMCTGNCPVKENCYRYMAEPNKYGQTYSSLENVCLPTYSEFIPYKNKEEKKNTISYTLEDFIMNETNNKKNETN